MGVADHFDGDAVAAAMLGGIVLGASVAFKTGMNGEVLGISGTTRGMMNKPSVDRAAFLVGLVLSGVLMSVRYGGFEQMPPPSLDDGDRALLLLRFTFGGYLVGLGTAFGNGCTSGHGLTGLARLTKRSWVAVLVFMASAAIVASLSNSLGALPPDAQTELEAPSWQDAALWSFTTVGILCIMACWRIASKPRAEGSDGAASAAAITGTEQATEEEYPKAKAAVELISGFSFGIGLSISTMSRPSKVAGFLDLGSGAWDPSLGFVMFAALLVTFPFYQILERKSGRKPLLGGKIALPPKGKAIDRSLVIGTMLFGIGWGTCGMCPGPVWLMVGAVPSLEAATVLLSMLMGMATWAIWQRMTELDNKDSRTHDISATHGGSSRSVTSVVPSPEKSGSGEAARPPQGEEDASEPSGTPMPMTVIRDSGNLSGL